MADAPAPPAADGERTRLTRGQMATRGLAVAVVLGIILMWIYVLTADPPVPGRLQDPAFAAAAEPICAATHTQVEALPKAQDTPDPAQRSAVIAQGTELLTAMIDQLEAKTPTAQPDKDQVAEWIADWRTYLQNRRDYATRLLEDPTARFYVSQRVEDGSQITSAMDRFAKLPVNDMPSCVTPDDV